MSRSQRLVVALVLNLSLVASLVAVGFSAHSLGVAAAGGDYLADAAGIGLALGAYPLSRRFPRAHSMAALVNAGWLVVLSVVIAVTAVARLGSGTGHVHGLPVVIVSSMATLVMVTTALVLKIDLDDDDDDGDQRLSSRAVLLDTVADAAAAAGVALTGLVIWATHGLDWLDPAVALVIALVIGYHAAHLVRDIRHSIRR